jgi:hypothetical protein
MHLKNIRVESTNYDAIKELIISYEEPDNITDFDQGCQIAYENHSFLNENDFIIVILLIKHSESINLSILCGGASSGALIKFDWGVENSSITKIWNEIEIWCKSNSIKYEVLCEE